MLQGILPGSLKAPIQTHSKLLKKRDELFDLYKKHFSRHLSAEAITNEAQRNPGFASQVFIDHGGQFVLHTGLVPETKYYKTAIQKFITEAKNKGLVARKLGQGIHGLTLLMQEQGHSVVVKLPVNPTTDFEGDGYVALQNEYDHGQKIAAVSDIDHSLVSRPIDQMSIRGKVLAFAEFGGQDLFERDDYNNNVQSAFTKYAARQAFEPARIAELIKVYMEAYKAQIPTMSYGSPHNTRLIEDGKAIALFDMCSQPPTLEHDMQQSYLQQKLFGKQALACALFMTLSNGNINLLLEGEMGSRFRMGIVRSSQDSGESFFQYREKLLEESLQVLLDKKVITQEELLVNLESLRDVNDRMSPDILEYMNFKGDGKLILKGQDLAQRLLEHFKK